MKEPALQAQADYWEQWNRSTREGEINPLSDRQARMIWNWVADQRRSDLQILDVGCGSGWMCERLAQFGAVTGLDLSASMLQRAQQRVPQARFMAKSILECDLPPASFDVIVTMEVIAHVADQHLFFRKCAELLKPNGMLLLTVQNRPIYERMREIAPPSPHQIRKWLSAEELKRVADGFDIIDLVSIVPRGYGGFLRYVNSVKLNAVLNTLCGAQRIEEAKERLGLGCTLVLRARKAAI
jgi:ubiquinone biosynthesis O-methyltransferase